MSRLAARSPARRALLWCARRNSRRGPAVHRLAGVAARPDDRVQPVERERLHRRPNALRRRRDPRDAAALRPAGRLLRPRQHLRPLLPAHDRGVPAHDRGSDVLRGHAVRQPRGRRLRPLLLRRLRRLARRRRQRHPAAWAIAFQAAARPCDDRARQPLAGHQRPRAARPAVRARRDRPRQARRLDPQDRPRPREHVPQPRHRRPVRRDRPPLRSDDGRPDLPGTVDDLALFQLIPTWRETAWRNAERLVPRPRPSGAPRSPPASRRTPLRRPRRSG